MCFHGVWTDTELFERSLRSHSDSFRGIDSRKLTNKHDNTTVVQQNIKANLYVTFLEHKLRESSSLGLLTCIHLFMWGLFIPV